MRPRKARASASTSPATRSWLTTSTSCMRDTGLKKWMPTSRSGRGSPSRNCSSGMLDVLVARIASGFIFGSMPAKILRLRSRTSGTASMIRSAVATPSPLRSGISRSSASRDPAAVVAADLAVKVGGALDSAGDRLRLGIAEADRKTVPRAPRGDVAAHGAGADDMDAVAVPFAVGEAFSGFRAGRTRGPDFATCR